ncbi:MAG: hypothetical protein JST09_00095 [Bacteroidetes bacterium]|nr:hypothetical protein [Bacteroidota bacterium]
MRSLLFKDFTPRRKVNKSLRSTKLCDFASYVALREVMMISEQELKRVRRNR